MPTKVGHQQESDDHEEILKNLDDPYFDRTTCNHLQCFV